MFSYVKLYLIKYECLSNIFYSFCIKKGEKDGLLLFICYVMILLVPLYI